MWSHGTIAYIWSSWFGLQTQLNLGPKADALPTELPYLMGLLDWIILWEGIIVPLDLHFVVYPGGAGVEEVSLVYPGTLYYPGRGRWAGVEEGGSVEEGAGVEELRSSTPAPLG